MKSRLNRKNVKLKQDEAGFALLGVLVMLILGGIILVPLLLLMTAGLTSSHVHEGAMLRFYAADVGIEEGIYRVIHDIDLPEVGGTYTYILEDEESQVLEINGSTVEVEIYGEEAGTYRITSIAADNNDGKTTTVESYVSTGPGEPFPLFDYAVASSNSNLTIRGNVEITSSPEQGNGDIYANGRLKLVGNVSVDGDAVATDRIITIGNVSISGDEVPYLDPPLDSPSRQEIQEMAQEYKSQAEQGGYHSGNYRITGYKTVNLGPLHIGGDLRIAGHVTIILGGTVYVDDDIVEIGNVTILGPGTLVAGDDIIIAGNSGVTPDKLPVIMSVNGDITCIGNSDLDGVLYAANGEIELLGNFDIYGAVVGASVSINGNPSIIYPVELREREDLPRDLYGGSPAIVTYTIE